METPNNPNTTDLNGIVIELPFITAQQLFITLNEYLTYLQEEYAKYVVCFNDKEKYDKEVLSNNIIALKNRIDKLAVQLSKPRKVVS